MKVVSLILVYSLGMIIGYLSGRDKCKCNKGCCGSDKSCCNTGVK
jgi:hypothetical protein